jgi:cell fate regulator YaaT (PSP1 superfamily)
MIKIAEVQFHTWDKSYDFYFDIQDVKIGDDVLVKTEIGMEVGRVLKTREEKEDKYNLVLVDEWGNENSKQSAGGNDDKDNGDSKIKLMSIIRKVNEDDLSQIEGRYKQKSSAMKYCSGVIKRMGLAMKLIDANISFDNKRITFAFIADGRVDFRELVKEMTRHFQKSVRMQQLGTRDEAKVNGDFAHCGRKLCCQKFLKTLGGVNSELAANQQVAHRGSERLSGACGRLMCCLRYENSDYVDLIKNMPKIGSEVDTNIGKGKVISWHTLKQTVDVRVEQGENKSTIVEVEVGKK